MAPWYRCQCIATNDRVRCAVSAMAQTVSSCSLYSYFTIYLCAPARLLSSSRSTISRVNEMQSWEVGAVPCLRMFAASD